MPNIPNEQLTKLNDKEDIKMEELMLKIIGTVDKKKVKSLCNKILKKCSFKSENDLRNISSLATWLYIYGYYDEMIEVCDLVKDMKFGNNYNIWFILNYSRGLKIYKRLSPKCRFRLIPMTT